MPPQHPSTRTFCLLPATTHALFPYWNPVKFDPPKTEDEVSAHVGMFNPRTNASFYEMGQEVVSAVREAVSGT